MRAFNCDKCCSPSSNIKHERIGETVLFKCSNYNVTSKGGIECDGLVGVTDQDVKISKQKYTEDLKRRFYDKIADEPCVT